MQGALPGPCSQQSNSGRPDPAWGPREGGAELGSEPPTGPLVCSCCWRSRGGGRCAGLILLEWRGGTHC